MSESQAHKGANGLEIERKFLMDKLPRDLESLPSVEIQQGYIHASQGFEARLRRKDEKLLFTIKMGEGRTRQETEIELSREQFDVLWPLSEGRRVEKRRYMRSVESLVIEYDVYSGALQGLAVAEIEFDSEETCESFVPPEHLGLEVTGDNRYANKNLALNGAP